MRGNMRDLKTSDIYKMSKILKKMNLKLEVNEKTSQTQMGAEMIQRIAENIHLAEKEVNEFISELIGISADEFANLSIKNAKKYIDEFKKLEGISDFLKLAGKAK